MGLISLLDENSFSLSLLLSKGMGSSELSKPSDGLFILHVFMTWALNEVFHYRGQ